MFDFTLDIDNLTEFIGRIRTRGGRDVAEDVTGAIEYATRHFSFNPQAQTCIFLITDAPTHGKQYNDMPNNDHLYNGIKDLSLENALGEMWNKLTKDPSTPKPDFACIKMTSDTDKMYYKMQRAFKGLQVKETLGPHEFRTIIYKSVL